MSVVPKNEIRKIIQDAIAAHPGGQDRDFEDAMDKHSPGKVEEKMLDVSDPSKVEYKSKIVGVTFEGRQEIIAMLKGDEPLRVRREPENEYDKRAVAVDAEIAETWHPIGYIAKDKNKQIATALDSEQEVSISIASITGGGDKSYGVNIALSYPKVEFDKAGAPKVEDGSKVNSEATMDNSQTLHLSKKQSGGISNDSVVLEKIKAILGVQETKKQYTSRVLGKTIEVIETNGHVTIPGFMSGSKFPEQFFRPFEKEDVLEAMCKKYDVQSEHVEAMWNINGTASTSFGTSIHAALENFDTYHKLGDKIKKVETFKTKPDRIGPNKSLSRNPFLRKIVEDFQEKFGGDYVRFSEQFVWHLEKRLCGSIDRVKVIDADKRIVRIQDFKTDGDINEKKYQNSDSPFKKTVANTLLGYHQLQLSFYAYILKQYGYTVEGLDIYWLNPTKLCTGDNAWEHYELNVIDIEGVL